MIIEMRTYRIQPTRVGEYLSIYEQQGLSLQCEILGALLGCFQTEVGPLNEVVYLWGFASLDERAQRRATLAARPQWIDYVHKVAPLFVTQDSKILSAACFSPIR